MMNRPEQLPCFVRPLVVEHEAGASVDAFTLELLDHFVAPMDAEVQRRVSVLAVNARSLALLPTGPALAAVLAHVEPATLTADAQLAYVAASERLIAWATARQNAGLVAFAGSAPRVERHTLDGRQIDFTDARRTELALELLWSEPVAARKLETARVLASDLPATSAALQAGAIDPWRASALVEGAQVLTGPVGALLEVSHDADDRQALRALRVDALRHFEAAALPYASTHAVGRTREKVRRVIAALDPAGAAARRAIAVRTRTGVSISHDPDGMSTLTATMPTEEAVTCLTIIDALAKDATCNDMTLPVGVRRANAMHQLIMASSGTAATPSPRVHLNVTIDQATLLGLRQESAMLDGAGPIPADVVRRLVADGGGAIRWLITDAHGAVSDASPRRYRLSAGMRALISSRDRTCRAPNCTRPAMHADIDHVEEYDTGGGSTPDNLGLLCSRHHQAKTLRIIDIDGTALSLLHGSVRAIAAEPALPAHDVLHPTGTFDPETAEQQVQAVRDALTALHDRIDAQDELAQSSTDAQRWQRRALELALEQGKDIEFLAHVRHASRHGMLDSLITRVLDRQHTGTCPERTDGHSVRTCRHVNRSTHATLGKTVRPIEPQWHTESGDCDASRQTDDDANDRDIPPF